MVIQTNLDRPYHIQVYKMIMVFILGLMYLIIKYPLPLIKNFRSIPSPIPKINLYGYDFQGPPPREARITTNYYASHKHHRGLDGLSKAGWICPKCENVKFVFITKCLMLEFSNGLKISQHYHILDKYSPYHINHLVLYNVCKMQNYLLFVIP